MGAPSGLASAPYAAPTPSFSDMPGIRKLYHSIREVSDLTGLKPHVLRYWETEFSELKPKKNRAGNRVYTDRDIEIVRAIQRLTREERYTIDGARAVLADALDGASTSRSDRAALEELRGFLSELRDSL